jgi:hypothetical protein
VLRHRFSCVFRWPVRAFSDSPRDFRLEDAMAQPRDDRQKGKPPPRAALL